MEKYVDRLAKPVGDDARLVDGDRVGGDGETESGGDTAREAVREARRVAVAGTGVGLCCAVVEYVVPRLPTAASVGDMDRRGSCRGRPSTGSGAAARLGPASTLGGYVGIGAGCSAAYDAVRVSGCVGGRAVDADALACTVCLTCEACGREKRLGSVAT